MNIEKELSENIDNPAELEGLYRKHSEEFESAFDSVFEKNSDSDILKTWNERLHFKPLENEGFEKSSRQGEILFVVLLSIVAAFGAGLPEFVDFVKTESYFVNMEFFLFIPPALYFIVKNSPKQRIITRISILFLISLIYINFLAGNIITGEQNSVNKPNAILSDALTLAYLHMPFFLWALVGVSFIGNDLSNYTKRMDFLRLNGGVLVYFPILIISGAFLLYMSLALFQLIDVDIPNFIGDYLPFYAGFGVPIIATYLVTQSKAARNLASTVSKILSPLVLVILIIYLVMIPISGENPFTDRDFLMVFNIVLIVVLGLTIFSISERGKSNLRLTGDYINFALILVVLIIDLVALSAILFRLTSYGLTPNRIAVLGINLLIFVNLAGVISNYVRFFQEKSGIKSIEVGIARYLPVYAVWAAFVAFGFPLIFFFIGG
ncbi:DUF4153 domain-containing protein [archaeon]|nr:DUF4153 domain-containing protein [archaeon]